MALRNIFFTEVPVESLRNTSTIVSIGFLEEIRAVTTNLGSFESIPPQVDSSLQPFRHAIFDTYHQIDWIFLPNSGILTRISSGFIDGVISTFVIAEFHRRVNTACLATF